MKTAIRWVATLAAGVVTLATAGEARAAWETANVGGMDTRIYDPATQSPAGDGKALMIVLHGCTQNADHLKDFGNLDTTAEDMGVVMAVPNVPFGGVIAGCWDYYGAIHSRASGHNAPLIALAETLRDDPTYGIDPSQIYVVGFSSGGGQALILGCLAPDIFAGVGLAAAPGLGTTVNQIPQVGTTGPASADLCTSFAGPNAADLTTQLGVAFTDANDFTVAQGYADVNGEMFGLVMSDGLTAMTSEAFDLAALAGAMPSGSGTVYSDSFGPRVAVLKSMGVSHNWPAGSGEAGGALSFVAPQGLHYAQYLAEFFAENSLRAEGWTPGDDDDDDDGGDDDDDDADDDGGDDDDDDVDDGGDDDDDDDGSGDDGGGGGGGDGGAGGDGGPVEDGGFIEPTGCQCRSTPRRTAPAGAWLLPLLLTALRRRR